MLEPITSRSALSEVVSQYERLLDDRTAALFKRTYLRAHCAVCNSSLYVYPGVEETHRIMCECGRCTVEYKPNGV